MYQGHADAVRVLRTGIWPSVLLVFQSQPRRQSLLRDQCPRPVGRLDVSDITCKRSPYRANRARGLQQPTTGNSSWDHAFSGRCFSGCNENAL